MDLTNIGMNALSLCGFRWVLRGTDERQVMSLVQRHALPEIVARVLVGRGVKVEEAEHFLNPTLRYHLPEPEHLIDMDAASERLAGAITSGEQVAIFGDYDVDGATSSALLVRYLRAVEAKEPLVYIPDRMKEGYGPNAKALLSLKEAGATLVVTVDCGTVSFEPLAAAHEAGIDVVVVDHHQGDVTQPKAYAVVNPNRFDETSECKQLAAVGVTYLLIVATNRRLRESGWFGAQRAEPSLLQWLDLVALGTVCDVVPLTGLNRAFVAQGIKILGSRANVGLRTLADVARLDEKPSAYHLGFVLGPRINAGGRVGKSDLGVRLLTTSDETQGLELAKELDRLNAERKAIEAVALEEAMAQAEAKAVHHPFLMIAGPWHPGVIGIIAGRIKEQYHRPVAVVALENGFGKASARSVSGIDLGAAVVAAKGAELILSGGGHAMAAGFNVAEGMLPKLQAFFDTRLGDAVADYASSKTTLVDGYLSLPALTPELVMTLERAAPFGAGNPSPRFVLSGARIIKADVVGSDHVRTILVPADKASDTGRVRIAATAFRSANHALGKALLGNVGREIQLLGQAKLNFWQGRESVDFTIEDAMIER